MGRTKTNRRMPERRSLRTAVPNCVEHVPSKLLGAMVKVHGRVVHSSEVGHVGPHDSVKVCARLFVVARPPLGRMLLDWEAWLRAFADRIPALRPAGHLQYLQYRDGKDNAELLSKEMATENLIRTLVF